MKKSYRISEIAEMMECTPKRAIRRLKQLGVPLKKVGRHYEVTMQAILELKRDLDRPGWLDGISNAQALDAIYPENFRDSE